MFKKFLPIVFAALFFYALALPFQANADWKSTALQQLGTVNRDLQLTTDIKTPISGVLKAALAFVGTIFLVLTIYAGILWMTAAGKEEQVGTARKIITASVIGLFIVMSSYAITNYVTTKLGAAPGGGAGGGPGGGDEGTGFTADECHAQGGLCMPSEYSRLTAEHSGVGSIDASSPCDLNGTMGSDPLEGPLGPCRAGGICCEVKDWFGDEGRGKCQLMADGLGVPASCRDSCGGDRPIDIGDCDRDGADDLECCAAMSSP